MSFYVLLLAINVCSFLPLYALNFRTAPNPLEFLFRTEKSRDQIRLKYVYAKPNHTDPFRLNFDFTIVVLLAAATGYSPRWLIFGTALLAAIGFVDVAYTATMHAIFKRPPSIASDISLIKAGLRLAQRHRQWIVLAVIGLLATITAVSYAATAWLFRLLPQDGLGSPPQLFALLLAALLTPLGLYHWRSYGYPQYIYRTVFSPLLHLHRNVEYSRRVRAVLAKDSNYFTDRNYFKDVALRDKPPNIITICVESYGSVVYRDSQYSDAIADLLAEYETELAARGYSFVSTYSEPPIFAGGSWLSYTSLTYGFRLTDMQLFDGLFTYDSSFGSYESLFHVLKRNGYASFVLCPLGGIEARTVDWDAIDRCFQSDRDFDFDSVGYCGPLVNYFGPVRLCAPPDQYSLNYGYEAAKQSGRAPFSLFFCTLNSHYPWHSPAKAVADWRGLNNVSATLAVNPSSTGAAERYRDAIRYQLDYVLRFVLDHAEDDPLVVVFGDHQPPFLTEERMGKQTPLHVIGRDHTVTDVLRAHGFAAAINLTGLEPTAIKHEGFLSLFLKAVNAAHGTKPDLEIAYRQHGITLFEEV